MRAGERFRPEGGDAPGVRRLADVVSDAWTMWCQRFWTTGVRASGRWSVRSAEIDPEDVVADVAGVMVGGGVEVPAAVLGHDPFVSLADGSHPVRTSNY